jgi:hypothetical protein
MPRACTCGSAKTPARSLIGPQGHGGLLERGDPLAGRSQHRGLAKQRDQFPAMPDARRVAGEALVAGPFGTSGDSAEACELAVVADRQDHVAVGRRKS